MPLPGRPRLARTGDVVANWMKDDIKGVVKPLAYVIKETGGADQPPVFHVVPAGKSFKNWATDRLVSHPAGKLEVQGSIQPRAPGRALLSEAQLEATDRGQRASGARRFSEEQLQMIARSGFEAIESGARHGFVFGDIKPENIMTDGSDCKFVDLDALQKVSKQGGEPSLEAHTPSYLLPLAFHSAQRREAHQAGVERDLYAFGMTLVEAALRSARRYDLATSLTSVAVGSTSAHEAKQRYQLHRTGSAERAWLDARAVPPGRRTIDQENKVKEGSPLWNDIKSRLGDYPVEPGSALDFGLECLREALHYDSRGKSKVYDPARAGDDHPLKALAQHPTIAAKVAAR